MNLLERVKRIWGAEEAFGLTLTTRDHTGAHLPEGGKLLGYSHQTYFCFIEGYMETVFAVDDHPESVCLSQRHSVGTGVNGYREVCSNILVSLIALAIDRSILTNLRARGGASNVWTKTEAKA